MWLLTFNSYADNIYSTHDNQIVLKANKKRLDVIPYDRVPMTEKGSWYISKIFPDIVGLPDSLKNIKVFYQYINFNQLVYQAFKANQINQTEFDDACSAWGVDTTQCINRYVKSFVVVALAKSDKFEYCIIDSDNDLDLSNNTPIQIDKRYSALTLTDYQVVFEQMANSTIYSDSTWVSLNILNRKEVLINFCEYTETTFQFNTATYTIKAFPSIGRLADYGSYSYFEITNDKDQTVKTVNFNQDIPIDNTFYKINCSIDGREIKLTKDNILVSGGTQVGMPPISFNALSVKGDTINFPHDFKNKYVLLDFWHTRCAPCLHEIKETYLDLYEKYGRDKFEIIGVANNSKEELIDFLTTNQIKWINIADKENKVLLKQYDIYAYPTVFLISPDGIIINDGHDLSGRGLITILSERIKN
jgi:thiol-disulfide isomerase/thioredoxin